VADTSNRYINRELSWLEFNQRVLDEAADPGVALLDRLFFLAVTGSNLDEFFMVRVGGLELLRQAGVRKRDPAGLSPAAQLKQVARRARRMARDQYTCYRDGIVPGLAEAGIDLARPDQLAAAKRRQMRDMFAEELLPVLTPLPLDQCAPFPLLQNLGLYLAVSLEVKGEKDRRCRFAAVPLGPGLDRLLTVADGKGNRSFLFLEDVVADHVRELFPGREVKEAVPFRVTRNAGMSVREDFAEDLVAEMERVLKQRLSSACVRLEVGQAASPELVSFLAGALEVNPQFVLKVDGPIDLCGLRPLVDMEGYERLASDPWPPRPCPDIDAGRGMFEQIAERDILLSHPFESFDPVVRLVTEAAEDPDVLAIKQIFYRTSPDSPIIRALRRAAAGGKYVTAVVELKARFDEARNITWARELEEAGVQVIYGVKHLKTHAKVCIVVRRESDGIARYMHFGTGNYNDRTAHLYTDVGLLTRDRDLGTDATAFFNAVTGHSQPREYVRVVQSPYAMRDRLLELIASEAARKRQGQRARIMAKMNSLSDPALIDALYDASQAGVEILLNVRGICCLRPGVPGLSENIRVVSIVDRFLEHSRIFYFYHGGARQVFMSSADWMPRNLDRRVELLVPVGDKICKRKLIAILETCFADNVKARQILPDGGYEPAGRAGQKKRVRAQQALYEQARDAARRARRGRQTALTPHVAPQRGAT